VLGSAPLARFWRGIRVESSRDDVIWRYEIGLSRLLHRGDTPWTSPSITAASSERAEIRRSSAGDGSSIAVVRFTPEVKAVGTPRHPL
jgi:hypothetical protein